MPEMKTKSEVLRIVDEVIAKHPDMFKALEEYDKTGKLRKIKKD